MFGDANYFSETGAADRLFGSRRPVSRDVRVRLGITAMSSRRSPGIAVRERSARAFAHLGLNGAVVSDHTDVRPRMLALVGLTDHYVHDGGVLAEWTESRLRRMHLLEAGGLH